MGQIAVVLNGRTYRLACGEGQEDRLQALADHIKSKVDTLAIEFGQVGEDRLLLMAALLVTDELFDARERAAALMPQTPVMVSPGREKSAAESALPSVSVPTEQPELAARLSVPTSAPKLPGKPPRAPSSSGRS